MRKRERARRFDNFFNLLLLFCFCFFPAPKKDITLPQCGRPRY